MSTPSKLIRLNDGLLVEVEASEHEYENVSSSGSSASRVEAALENIEPLLRQICLPIVNTWEELNKDVSVEQAEVEIGLSFEGEGNIYITRTKASANLNIKLVMKQN